MRRTPGLLLALAVLTASVLAGAAPAPAATTLTQAAKWYTGTFSGFYNGNLTTEAFSSPAVGDVAGDSGPDIVAGYPDGKIRVWTTGGSLQLEFNTGAGAIQSSPALVDLNGDGRLDILTSNLAGRVVGFTGGGTVLFDKPRPGCGNCGVFGTPTAADIDRDGQLEIVAPSFDQRLYVWNVDGSNQPGFPIDVQDSIWSSPAVADIDGDGYLEIIVGGDCDGVPGQYCYPNFGGYLWVFRHDGSRQYGWPQFVPQQVVWSSPAVADLNRDGSLDIIVGTGLFDPAPGGQKVYAWDRWGSPLPGWPVNVGGRVMASPAIGDIDGDGSPDVVTMADDGRIYAHSATGALKSGFPQCNANNRSSCPVGLHGTPVLADLDGDGAQEIVSGGEQWVRVFGAGGTLKANVPTESGTLPLTGAPTVAQINGHAWVITSAVFTSGGQYKGSLWAWSTGTALGRADWPTFKQNIRRTGRLLDVDPPAAALGNLPGSSSSAKIAVTWSGDDAGSGIARFDVDVRDGAGPWVRWIDGAVPLSRSGSTASGGANLYGVAGHTYTLRTRATDGAANTSAWSAEKSTTVSGSAPPGGPVAAGYSANVYGAVSSLGTAPAQGPTFGFNAARGVAAARDGGGYVLDLYGGVHPVGGAPSISTSGYWPGWDIARGLALNPDGKSGYVMDGWGGLHPVGGAARVTNNAYWPGWYIAKAIVLTPSSTKANPAGYVLDAFGGIHPFGSAPSVGSGGYWSSWDIARGIALDPTNPLRGYVLDGWGGLHPFGGAPRVASGGYWSGWDIARGVALASNGQSGWVLDGFGGLHRFGGAALLESTRYWGQDVAKGISVLL